MSKTVRRDSTTGRFLQNTTARVPRVQKTEGVAAGSERAAIFDHNSIGDRVEQVASKTRNRKKGAIRGQPKPSLHIAPAAAEIVGDRIGAAVERFRLVSDSAKAQLLLLTPADLEELIEDAFALAAYDRTRDQESVPAEVVDRLLAGQNPVRVWREYRGLSLPALAEKAGLGKGYLSQIETGGRAGTVATLTKLARALSVDLDDLLARPAA